MEIPPNVIVHWLSDIERFSRLVLNRPLRSYQLLPARTILESVTQGHGDEFAVMMCRQAGKNEVAAHLEAYLMNLYQRRGGQIIKASPTFKPQTINSMLRLEACLDNPWNARQWRKTKGYIYKIGNARTMFFSADPTANVVGGTASLLLECDEAQDVTEGKWNKDFAPMGASTNVTTVYWGTAWTSQTMLAQQVHHLTRQQTKDGRQRVFRFTADLVGKEIPAYATYVQKRVAKLGRNHPLVKTQYYLEEIDAQAGMFPPQRQALMRGSHDRRHEPEAGHRYALLLDVAGEDEAKGDSLERAMLSNPKRDATALTVVDAEYHYGKLPVYRTVDRKLWLGIKHTSLYQRILALARFWRAVWVVVDATGLGHGLASFLSEALGDHTEGGRVIPVVFSHKTKSDLGWNYLAVVETGRYHDYTNDQAPDTRQFWHEVGACQREVGTGPNHSLKWGVWDNPAYDGLIAHGHDDALLSASLCAVLDQQEWPGVGLSGVVEALDPLDEIDSTTSWG